MRQLLAGISLLAACASDPISERDEHPVATMTVPARLFIPAGDGALAQIDLLDGTPIIGASIRVRSAMPTSAHACALILDPAGNEFSQCSEHVIVDGPTTIHVPMAEVTADPDRRFALSASGSGVEVDAALIAIRVLPDPL
jgi:hypothetical protein